MPHRQERPSLFASRGVVSAICGSIAASSPSVTSAGGMMQHLPVKRVQGKIMAPAADRTPKSTTSPGWPSKDAGAGSPTLGPESPANTNPSDAESPEKPKRKLADMQTGGESESQDAAEVAAASALLLAHTKNVDSSSSNLSEKAEAVPLVPLKKRKKHLDFLRRNQDLSVTTPDFPRQPCHVSPASSGAEPSSSTGVVNAVPATRTSSQTPHADVASPDTSSQASSQDTKDAASVETDKPADINLKAPLPHIEVPHFPSILHGVLTQSEFSGPVMHWLPHGYAWKVLRWDALRREVLPRYFPQLREEDGKGSGSIDAFLWHLRAWGFEEIKGGPDIGAYYHVLFRREYPKICRRMVFSAASNTSGVASPKSDRNSESGSESPHTDEGSDSILQVPSLTSARSDGENEAKQPDSPGTQMVSIAERGMRRSSIAPFTPTQPVHCRASVSPSAVWPARQIEAPLVVNYRPEEAASNDGWTKYPESPFLVPAMVQCPPAFDLRFPFRHPIGGGTGHTTHHYSPPRVRSGRGASRGAGAWNLQKGLVCQRQSPVRRNSFPISSRGKAPRRPLACRATAAESAPNSLQDRPLSLLTTQAQISAVTSRKTKRKLPLSRKTEPT